MRFPALFLALALAGCRQEAARPPSNWEAKPDLALLTSLPIVFGERFGLDAPPSPLLKALEERFTVRAVDGPEQLRPMGLLLAVQPQAMTAERLVALDKWVRKGGRLMLLADPRLSWESSRPLGDRFRPPAEFPDSGLLQRWGLTLAPGSVEGETRVRLSATQELTVETAGVLTASGGSCKVDQGLLAVCSIGRGTVFVLADADAAMRDDAARLGELIDLLEAVRRG